LAIPTIPIVTGPLTVGDGISDIVLRICDAYRVTSEKGLAENLNILKNTIGSWEVRKKFPNKYLLRAAKETGHPVTWFLG